MMDFEQYKVNIPEAECGDWKISKYTVTEQEEKFQMLRCALNPHRPARWVPAGEYTRLTRNGTIVMSDTPDEIRDHLTPILNTHKGAHCIVGGLGLGMVVEAMLRRSETVKVTVIELSAEVIELVGTHLKERYGDRLEIINDDLLLWTPPRGAYYDVAWFDIWDNIDMDNLKDMRKLKERYRRRADLIGCWQEDGCRGQKRRIATGRGFY